MKKRTKKLLAMMAASPNSPKLRRVSGLPPLSYTAKEVGFLDNYRIYGQTSRNLFDMKKFAELCFPRFASVTFADNTLSFTSTAVDAYVNYVCGEGDTVVDEYRPSCIDVLPSTTYTISMSSAPKCYISWINSSYKAVSAYTRIPDNQSSYTFTTPENCTKLLFRLGKNVTNIGDTFTISDIMLNAGFTPLPYEPYGESVGDRTKNLLDEKCLISPLILDGVAYSWYFDTEHYIRTTDITNDPRQWLYKNCQFYITLPTGAYILSVRGVAGTSEYTGVGILNSSDQRIVYRNLQNIANFSAGFILDNTTTVGLMIKPFDGKYRIMILQEDTSESYEPYGYKIPITISNDNSENAIIYLPSQLHKYGNAEQYVEYIDFETQTMHIIQKNLFLINKINRVINGIWFLTNPDGSVTIQGTLRGNRADWVIYDKNQVTLPSGEYYFSCKNATSNIKFISGGAGSDSTGQVAYMEITNDNSVLRSCIGGGIGHCIIRVETSVTTPITLYPMIRKSDIEDDTFEPYFDSPELDVTLPALPTVTGTNVLSVGTEVQPSIVEVTGRIKPVPTEGGE